uniref:Uncharacterized protein n=1 Tax=Caenorhabditis japonica TaxID=281687 RepID=A0A8R1DT82_CAEJA
MSQEPEDIEKEDPSKQEENVIDLTTDDENEVEMEEVPAVDLQVIYDAPSSVVADVLQNLMDSEEAEKENENENIEEILIDDDEEDEILHVEDTIRTDEQKLEIRKEKLDEFLSWFIRLKREQFTEPKINSPDYLTTIVEDEPIFDSDVAKLAMEKYKSLGTTDGLAEALELENLELALTAVCIGVLGADNELDIDFAPLCWDRVDEWTINRITRFLDLPISGLNARAGPLKLMKFCLTTPAQTIIALTIVWLKDQNHPLTLNFEDGDGTDFGPLRVNPWGLSRVIVDTAIRYWHERPHRNEEDAMSRELDEFFHELETTSAEIETNLERINTEKNEILQRGIEADKDYEDVDISELKFLDPRRKEDIERAKRKLEVLTADIKRITEAADECYKKKGQFMQMLVLNVGDWCLARNAGIDEKELMFAQIEAHVDSVTYRVKFCDTRQVCNVNIRDIAVTNFGMHHPIFDAIGDIVSLDRPFTRSLAHSPA